MSLPISFGVELEFCLAYLHDSSHIPESAETRHLKFSPGPTDITTPHPKRYEYQTRVHRHIASLLHTCGFPINLKNPSATSIHVWQVTDDPTIAGPLPSHPSYHPSYHYLGVEIKTPALPFTPSSLQSIEKVCTLLTTTYVLSTSPSTGLHIHLGCPSLLTPFSSSFLQDRLIPFLYIFEPQFSSLHPAARQPHEWGSSMRDTCTYTQAFQRKYGYRPLPYDILPLFRKCRNVESLLRAVSDPSTIKANNVNFQGLRKGFVDVRNGVRVGGEEEGGEGHTIEFRQHAGTLDGREVGMCVRTLVGMVRFLEEASDGSFIDMVEAMMRAERWEKEGDGRDAEREERLGPVPADGPFTIISLLR
ncbi:hypothetical protein EG329_011398 [Mollisiaceae sp. DMI_Dod_QoI]|nr:hypothetical protein EG329_011398 [Helotiales sp. DMI_Dod_QoI]